MASVAVIYHFYAHYREPIVRELMRDPEHEYLFYGAMSDPANSGIEAIDFLKTDPFVPTCSQFIKGRYLLQSDVLTLGMRQDIEVIIYLGDVQFLTTWLSAFIARLRGKRVLFWTHGWSHSESYWRSFLRRTFYKLAHGLLLYGHRARGIGIDNGFPPENLHVIYNSLDYENQKAIREKVTEEAKQKVHSELFGIPHRPLIICIARLIKPRQVDMLLEAAAHLAEDNCAVNIVIVGDGPEREAWQAMSEQLELSVRFLGKCYDEMELAKLFCAANITVIPAFAGLSVIHSLAYGTPVITHNNFDLQGPETGAIIPGLTGDFYVWNDSRDLARVIAEWLNRKSEKISQQCWQVVEQFYHPRAQCGLISDAVAGIPYLPDKWELRAGLITNTYSEA